MVSIRSIVTAAAVCICCCKSASTSSPHTATAIDCGDVTGDTTVDVSYWEPQLNSSVFSRSFSVTAQDVYDWGNALIWEPRLQIVSQSSSGTLGFLLPRSIALKQLVGNEYNLAYSDSLLTCDMPSDEKMSSERMLHDGLGALSFFTAMSAPVSPSGRVCLSLLLGLDVNVVDVGCPEYSGPQGELRKRGGISLRLPDGTSVVARQGERIPFSHQGKAYELAAAGARMSLHGEVGSAWFSIYEQGFFYRPDSAEGGR